MTTISYNVDREYITTKFYKINSLSRLLYMMITNTVVAKIINRYPEK